MVFNTILLLYWISIWFRSYRKHKDSVSLIVLLFVAQSFLREIWGLGAALAAVMGWNMSIMIVEANTLTRMAMAAILISIHYLVRSMKKENGKTDS